MNKIQSWTIVALVGVASAAVTIAQLPIERFLEGDRRAVIEETRTNCLLKFKMDACVEYDLLVSEAVERVLKFEK